MGDGRWVGDDGWWTMGCDGCRMMKYDDFMLHMMKMDDDGWLMIMIMMAYRGMIMMYER